MTIRRYLRFRVSTLLSITLLVAIIMTWRQTPAVYPPEVRYVLGSLKDVPPDADAMGVCSLLVRPLRSADYCDSMNHICYVELAENFRLAIEFEDSGIREFKSAQVQQFLKTRVWKPIYPIREKLELVYANGRKIQLSFKK